MALRQLWRERIGVGSRSVGITSTNLVSATGYSKNTKLARFHHAGGGQVLGSSDTVALDRFRGYGKEEWSPGARWEVSGDTDLRNFRMILPADESVSAEIDVVGYGDP